MNPPLTTSASVYYMDPQFGHIYEKKKKTNIPEKMGGKIDNEEYNIYLRMTMESEDTGCGSSVKIAQCCQVRSCLAQSPGDGLCL